MRLVVLALLAGCRVHFDARTDAAIPGDMPTADASDCHTTYAPEPGLSSLYELVPTTTSWLAAEASCEADGAHLIVIDDATENTFARSFNLSSAEHVWLGGGDQRSEGTFAWVTAQPFSYTHWGSTEPNNSMGIEDVLEIDSNGLWNDERNAGIAANIYHAVCECDGMLANPNSYCDTDSDASCGTCGDACALGTHCVSQVCH